MTRLTLSLQELRDLLHRKVVIVTTDDLQQIEIEMDWQDREKAFTLLDGGEGLL